MSARNQKVIFHNPFKDRSLIKRRRASDYILITLLSFAFSVSGTRLFLEITGYPQLGGGNVHIAHVLWGGLILFIATLLPIIYANEWIVLLSAALSGFGVGLFIDEVGKFITQNNDYFHPSAAPIIYVLFLFVVLLFSRVKAKRQRTTRSELYEVFERMTEVLDHDLSAYEREQLIQTLARVRSDPDNPEQAKLAESLQDFLVNTPTLTKSQEPNLIDKVRIFMARIDRKLLTKKRNRRWLIFGLFVWGIWAIVSPILFFTATNTPAEMQVFVQELMTNHLVRNVSGLTWFEAKVILEGGMGLASIAAGVLMCLKIEKPGIWIGLVSLLLTLTIVNLLVFYFDQFSTIAIAAFQFILLVLLLHYQNRYLNSI